MSKLIVIEGTDCSGKQTQAELLLKRLNDEGIKCEKYYFPNYESPTGKIVGGPFLGKSSICEGYFSEKAPNVDGRIASLYYAADRLYNIPIIKEKLAAGLLVILDRYTYSNMAHQGSKYKSKDERIKMYKWIEELEFDLLGLPKADIKIFLHMPLEIAKTLRKNREEEADQNETDDDYLKRSEEAYLEIADLYDFKTIECGNNSLPKSIDEIGDELYKVVKSLI